MLPVVLFLIFLPSVLSTCPPYAVQGFGGDTRCYVFKEIAVDYIQGHELCQKISGSLLSIQNIAINTWIQSQAAKLFAPLGYNSFWIGANAFNAATWAWIDGSPFEYQNWQNGLPATDVSHICGAEYASDGTWFASICNTERPFVCVVPHNPTEPPHVDPKQPYVAAVTDAGNAF
uniref:C-type lectin domain-containing protein n=1 Tax=Panagrolaimus sp. JU765 TaxID=591449 RepID=A0AC34Q770_9BILA